MQIRVYYEDTDAGGVVYYANYLKFAERARTELLRTLGFENKTLRDNDGVLLVVHRIEADYLKSARLDDLLTVQTVMDEIRNSSFSMKQVITREGVALFNLTVRIVCINLDGRPLRVPEPLKAALSSAAVA